MVLFWLYEYMFLKSHPQTGRQCLQYTYLLKNLYLAYKKHPYTSIRKRQLRKNWATNLKVLFKKRISKCPTGIWKNAQHLHSSRKMLNKIIMKYHFIVMRMSKMRKTDNTEDWPAYEKNWNSCTLLMKPSIGATL